MSPNHNKVSRGTVLVADDSRYVRLLVKKALESVGFAILEAENGIEAELIYKQFSSQIQLVVLDIHMPEQNGLITLEHLRTINPNLPVIILTGNAEKHNLVACSQMGISGFFAKPFKAEELRSKVCEILLNSPVQTHPPAPLKDLKLLILEEGLQLRVILQDILYQKCPLLLSACNLDEVQTWFQDFDPSLILIGFSQPQVVSHQIVEVKKIFNTADAIKILGYQNSGTALLPEERCIQGMNKVLPYPFKSYELIEAIEALIKDKSHSIQTSYPETLVHGNESHQPPYSSPSYLNRTVE
jgi:CheY-like chemotaxis protein